ncbi:MAG: virulence factor SrfB [Saprospiraceae bacterium]|nr:virulence factor SrfB [Saprospiraceae bacterium]
MDKMISLIANSGIQFHTIPIRLDEKSLAFRTKCDFAEIMEETPTGKSQWLAFPYYYDAIGHFIDKAYLYDCDAVNPDGSVDPEKINKKFVVPVHEHQVYSIRARDAMEFFEGTWLPLPYYRTRFNPNQPFDSGPEAWVRVWLSRIPVSERTDEGFTHRVILAFDTKCTNNEHGVYNTPTPDDADAIGNTVFACAADERHNSNLWSKDSHWAYQWIESAYLKRLESLGKKPRQEFLFQHVGYYLALLRTLDQAGAFPKVQFFQSDHSIDVALVLDIGNSRTCGILAETSAVGEPFDFTKARRLAIRDLTYPDRIYQDPFEMRLAVTQMNFGPKSVNQMTGGFEWPSIVRIGGEAVRLSVLSGNVTGSSIMSSPKRYLWDTNPVRFPWRFINSNAMVAAEGMGLHFTEDGKLIVNVDANYDIRDVSIDPSKAKKSPIRYDGQGRKILKERLRKGIFDFSEIQKDDAFGIDAHYSRSSMMIFALIEIFLHAISQCNSYEFRKRQGHTNIPRKLKTIVLTCPTAMLQTEQVRLREHAEDALDLLKMYFDDSFIDSLHLQIIPDPKDLGKPRENRKYWKYDEATCSQIAFIYGEINHRFRRDADLYFDIVGKYRNDVAYPSRPCLTIASVDIGGGTTDLMICSYQNGPETPHVTTLVPQPHFWEGFNLAGDDILRRIIERIVLPVIREEAVKRGAANVHSLMNLLFGPNLGVHSDRDRIMRRLFANQIAIPVAYNIIQHAADDADIETRSFDSFFIDYPRPSPEVIQYFNNKFENNGARNFSLEHLTWELDRDSTNSVVKSVIEKVIGDLSGIIAQYNCDYLLLAGRPSTLPIVRQLFLKYLPVTPDCIVPMGNYRIGTWYPFANPIGEIKDPKTCVAVGATIALMSDMNRLGNFTIKTEHLRQVDSTADFIGIYEKSSAIVQEPFLTPDLNSSVVLFDGAEILIGMRQMKTENWLASPMYIFKYKNPTVAAAIKQRNYSMPLQIEFERDFERNKEQMQTPIRNITDSNGTRVDYEQFFTLMLRSLVDEYGYWTDSGSFTLTIF